MKGIRLALSVIGVAYALLGLVVVYFAVNLGRSANIGAAYLTVGILAWGGTIAAMGLPAARCTCSRSSARGSVRWCSAG
jgi:hypothetical protein